MDDNHLFDFLPSPSEAGWRDFSGEVIPLGGATEGFRFKH
jgi:hypothetical protein